MYQYLNQANQWPRLRRFGLEVDPDTGELSLRKLPGPPRSIAQAPGAPPASPTAAGIAVGRDGSIYLSDPELHQVFRVDPQGGTARPLSCLEFAKPSDGNGDKPKGPRGLAYQACRDRLLIADSLNSRIQVIDPVRERVVAIWGQTWPYQTPQPCGKYGGLNGPEQLTCDRAGNVFVIDRENDLAARVVKLTRDGDVEKTFDCKASNPARILDPVHIAVGSWKRPAEEKQDERVFVLALDRSSNQLRLFLFLFDSEGKPLLTEPLKLVGPDLGTTTGAPSEVAFGFSQPVPAKKGKGNEPLETVTAFNVIGTTAVVALGTASPRVWCFDLTDLTTSDNSNVLEPSWLPLYDRPAVALGVRGDPNKPGAQADLLLFAGPGRDLLAFAHRGAYRTQGAFLGGPFTGNRDLVTQWHRLRFDGRLGENGHVKWFTLSRTSTPYPWSGPVRPRADRLPSWYRLETQPDLFAQLRFAPTAEVADAPDPDEFDPIQRPGSWARSLTPDRTPPDQWFAFEDNQFDGLVRNDGGTPDQPADQLWIFGLMAGDGKDSPVFSQARLEHDADGWLPDLPEVYQRNRTSRSLTRAILALLESRFEDVDEIIDQLPALFSPHAMVARYGRQSPEVDWLRAVVALPKQPRMGNTKPDRYRDKQMFVDGPFWLARRGTPEGLRRLVWLATGVDLVVDEPGLYDLPQVLGQPDLAGPESPGADPQHGISDENILGYSFLPDPGDPRPRLPDDLAHHFVVRGYESDLIDPDKRLVVEQVVRQMAPAHLTYSIQVIEPRARLGIQARLGIDAVVAPRHPADPFTLDTPPGPDAQLDPRPLPPTVGAVNLNRHTPLL
jgi:hypothetical protein